MDGFGGEFRGGLLLGPINDGLLVPGSPEPGLLGLY